MLVINLNRSTGEISVLLSVLGCRYGCLSMPCPITWLLWLQTTSTALVRRSILLPTSRISGYATSQRCLAHSMCSQSTSPLSDSSRRSPRKTNNIGQTESDFLVIRR